LPFIKTPALRPYKKSRLLADDILRPKRGQAAVLIIKIKAAAFLSKNRISEGVINALFFYALFQVHGGNKEGCS